MKTQIPDIHVRKANDIVDRRFRENIIDIAYDLLDHTFSLKKCKALKAFVYDDI